MRGDDGTREGVVLLMPREGVVRMMARRGRISKKEVLALLESLFRCFGGLQSCPAFFCCN